MRCYVTSKVRRPLLSFKLGSALCCFEATGIQPDMLALRIAKTVTPVYIVKPELVDRVPMPQVGERVMTCTRA